MNLKIKKIMKKAPTNDFDSRWVWTAASWTDTQKLPRQTYRSFRDRDEHTEASETDTQKLPYRESECISNIEHDLWVRSVLHGGEFIKRAFKKNLLLCWCAPLGVWFAMCIALLACSRSDLCHSLRLETCLRSDLSFFWLLGACRRRAHQGICSR